MRHWARAWSSSLAALMFCGASSWASVLRVAGGTLNVDAHLSAAGVEVGASGQLFGTGTISGNVVVDGVVAPGGYGNVADLRILGSLVFTGNGRFACDVTAHTTLDRLVVQDQVSGTGQVQVTQLPGAIPLDQLLIDAASRSDYRFFTLKGGSAGLALRATKGGDLHLNDALGDSDGDGMPDAFEMDHFGHRTKAGPDEDADRDGLTNLQERIAGTDPGDPESLLRLVAVEPLELEGFTLRWDSVAGRVYRILKSTDGGRHYEEVLSGIEGTPPQNSENVKRGAEPSVLFNVQTE